MQQPNSAPGWDNFTARQIMEEPDEAAIERPGKRRGAAKASPSLSELLLQAIQAAGARRGRITRAERIREATLLEVLTTAIRKAR